MSKKTLYAWVLLGAMASAAQANETAVRQAIVSKFPKMSVESVTK